MYRTMEEGGEEKPRWRSRLTIKVGGNVEQQACKCVMPLEWKEVVTRANRAPSAAIPKISFKVKLPAQPQPAGIKRYPRVEDVQCPGRASPVAVVFKLAVPAGYERDLVDKPGGRQGRGKRKRDDEEEGSDYRDEDEEEEEDDFEMSSASSDDERADASVPRGGTSGRSVGTTGPAARKSRTSGAGAALPVAALPPAKRIAKPGRGSAEKAAKGNGAGDSEQSSVRKIEQLQKRKEARSVAQKEGGRDGWREGEREKDARCQSSCFRGVEPLGRASADKCADLLPSSWRVIISAFQVLVRVN